MLNEILSVILAAAAAVIVMGMVRYRRQRQADKAAAAGKAPTVFASLRLLDGGFWRGRWRHGLAMIDGDEIYWRPRKPRPGPPVRLSHVRITDIRMPKNWSENWSLAPDTVIHRVVSADGPDEVYELALLQESLHLVEHL